MAWQLHYTSARSGPTGRSGFQFVAATPGLPPGVQAAVTPFMTYRPPPGAPLSPHAGELAGFPVALAYDLIGERALLVQCRYLGQDYSGRYGNFFAHAVVAGPEELEGLRPIELWHGDLWACAPGTDSLPVMEDVTPGEAVAPETLARWLGETAQEPLLTHLIDAVVGALDRGHGRVVLVTADPELVVRWIAVASYSLPVPVAARMSFITYSGDPGNAHQRIVGTTPDAWAAAHRDDVLSIDLDQGQDVAEASRFARTVARCWRESDFAGLDALGELTLVQEHPSVGTLLDRAAALLALCRGEPDVTAGEEAAAAGLLSRHGAEVPEWVWPELVPALPGMGFDLALAIHDWARGVGAAEVADRCAARCVILALHDPGLRDRLPRFGLSAEAADRLSPVVSEALERAADLTELATLLTLAVRTGLAAAGPAVESAAASCARRGAADLPAALAATPDEWRERLTEGALTGLADADDKVRAQVLTDAACDLLERRDWSRLPAVGLRVLASAGRRHQDRRLDITGVLLGLPGDIDSVLRELWAVPATPQECAALLDALPRHRVLAALPSRTFARAATDGARLQDATILSVAAKVREVFPADARAARDASAVLAYAEAVSAKDAEGAARALRAIEAAASELAGTLFDGAAHRLADRDPRFRAALLAAVPAALRARLTGCWVDGGEHRGRWGRAGMTTNQRNELVEVTLRLRRRGICEPRLDAWVRAVAGKRLASRQLDTYLRDHRQLRAALRELVAEEREG